MRSAMVVLLSLTQIYERHIKLTFTLGKRDVVSYETTLIRNDGWFNHSFNHRFTNTPTSFINQSIARGGGDGLMHTDLESYELITTLNLTALSM